MPTTFGLSEDLFCFGLPGNPASAFVVFEILVKPFLLRLMGHDFQPSTVPMRLSKRIARKRVKRDSWIPVRRSDPGSVQAVEYHGAAHINAYTEADGMICIPRGVSEVEEGDVVDVRQV